jgi:hypothetical protein
MNYVKLLALYVFTHYERQAFMDFVSEVRAPIRYVVVFEKNVSLNKLYIMKSHDHRVMLQHIVHASVQNLLHPNLRKTIIHLGRSFKRLCIKVLNLSDIPNLRAYVVYARDMVATCIL